MADSRKRSMNWTEDQLQCLATKYLENKRILDSKFTTNITSQLKRAKWISIADDVSSLGPERTVDQCKKKMSDTKSASKSKAARINHSISRTGGGNGTQETLSPLEALVVSKIPKVSYAGIPGGFDSSFSPSNSGEICKLTNLGNLAILFKLIFAFKCFKHKSRN